MRVLVTGGAGFIGSNLALTLQEQGHDVTVLDDFLVGTRNNLQGFEGTVINGDVRTFDWATIKADVIFNQAAITDTTVKDEQLMFSTNVEALKRLLDHCSERDVQLVYASSAAVYGNIPGPQRESDAGQPNNLYGISKWKGDLLAQTYFDRVTVTGLRYFNVFGPREAVKGNMASMIYQLYRQMAAGRRPRIFKWGEQKRDHIYVKDAVSANLAAWKARRSCIVNVGTGQATTFNTIVAELNNALGTSLEPDYFDNPYASAYQDFTQADLTNAKKLIAYEPRWTFGDGVQDYVRFLQKA